MYTYICIYIYILESSAALRAALILRGNRNQRGNRGEIVGQAGREWRADGCGSAWVGQHSLKTETRPEPTFCKPISHLQDNALSVNVTSRILYICIYTYISHIRRCIADKSNQMCPLNFEILKYYPTHRPMSGRPPWHC